MGYGFIFVICQWHTWDSFVGITIVLTCLTSLSVVFTIILFDVYASSHTSALLKVLLLKNMGNAQENICRGFCFFMKVVGSLLNRKFAKCELLHGVFFFEILWDILEQLVLMLLANNCPFLHVIAPPPLFFNLMTW